jgi:hypothetical protein
VRAKLKLLDIGDDLLQRAVNVGFSGGEKKRNEIFQMAMLEPRLAILDETDSGLDIDALRIVARGVNELRAPDRAIVMITHYQRLLDYVEPDHVHVLQDGRIVQSGDKQLAVELEAAATPHELPAARREHVGADGRAQSSISGKARGAATSTPSGARRACARVGHAYRHDRRRGIPLGQPGFPSRKSELALLDLQPLQRRSPAATRRHPDDRRLRLTRPKRCALTAASATVIDRHAEAWPPNGSAIVGQPDFCIR